MEERLPGHDFKTPGILRSAFQYQDLIGIELLIDFYRDPDKYDWVELDSDDKRVGSLDDVVAARSDNTYELVQVKFTPDSETNVLSWDWLLSHKKTGTSFLQKWSVSLTKARALGPIRSAMLRTNRVPDTEFGEALNKDRRVEIEKIRPSRRRDIEKHLGDVATMEDFFSRFEFSHSEQILDDLENQLKAELIPTDTDVGGWFALRDQVQRWASRKMQPEPDGRILHKHLVQIITKKRAQPIPQDFEIPETYCLPDTKFLDDIQSRLLNVGSPITVLWGGPGKGKSTFLSYFVKKLTESDIPVVRHHYFLSLDDTTNDRFSFSDISSSLMDQIVARYPEAIKGLNESPDQLRKWVTACGEYFAKDAQPFVVVIDGLDHVWRELTNTAQLEHLFNYLLPAPPNVSIVVGTQKVLTSQLPQKLNIHADDGDWKEIPYMDEHAVQNWIRKQHEAGRLLLPAYVGAASSEDVELGAIGSEFFSLSKGHPLHLIYSFEELVRRGAVVTTDEVKMLPECPEGDIRRYYRGLWSRLSPSAKEIAHLIAGTDFRWSPDGLRRCVGPIDEISHLLEHRRTGLIPFHGSLLAFAREEADHGSIVSALLPTVIEWLENDAGRFRRWGWLWLVQAQLGDNTNLIEKTTREWVEESLASGFPDEQIVKILAAAEELTFQKLDLPRTLELRALKTRVMNGPEFQVTSYSKFEETAIDCAANTERIMALVDALPTLSEERLVSLARLSKNRFPDVLSECVAEGRRRVNLWVSLRHRPGDEFVELSRKFVQILSIEGNPDLDRIIRFVEGFRDSESVFQYFVNCLYQQRCLAVLRELSRKIADTEQRTLLPIVHDAICRTAALDAAPIGREVSSQVKSVSPLVACHLRFEDGETSVQISVPNVPKNLLKEDHPYGRNIDLEWFFYEAFFYALAVRSWDLETTDYLHGDADSERVRWIEKAVAAMSDLADSCATDPSKMRFSAAFSAIASIDPTLDRHPSDSISAYYRALRRAVLRIGIDLQLLGIKSGASMDEVSKDELEIAASSQHWNEHHFLEEILDQQLLFLSQEAAQVFIDNVTNAETARLSPFNERAELWTQLARLARLYELPSDYALLRRAASCTIGYGWHKDLWIFDVLESIRAVGERNRVAAQDWLKAVAPVVEAISEFTDGDETNHAPAELVTVTAEVCPERLPDMYQHFIAKDEFSVAEKVLGSSCETIDFDTASGRALAKSLVESKDHIMLEDVDGAETVREEIARFVGGFGPARERGTTEPEEHSEDGGTFDVASFGPSNFSELLRDLDESSVSYKDLRALLQSWLLHWEEDGRHADAVACVNQVIESEQYSRHAETLLDMVFQVVLRQDGRKAAFQWLVKAHVHNHGWQSYWSSEEDILRRLNWAARNYKNNWAQFITETSVPAKYWQRRGTGFSIGMKYLIRYLVLVDQDELAERCTDVFVRILLADVCDQPIEPVQWISQ